MNPDNTPAALQAQVSGSSFYAGMRVLPKAEREAELKTQQTVKRMKAKERNDASS